MTNKDKPTRATHHRNIVRGVLSSARSSAFSKRAKRTDEIYRNGLRKALLSARSELRTAERSEFLDWFELITSRSAGAIEEALAVNLIGHIIPSSRISLADELEWLRRRLSKHTGLLAEFRAHADQLNRSFWSSDRDTVEATLGYIEGNFGLSLWLIETRIAIAQLYGGLEAQKSYATYIRKVHKGLPAYCAHFISIRNEERSTLRLFRADLCRRIQAAKLPHEAKTYLEYKLGDVFSQSDASVSSILRVEQGQSIIDVYETVIDVVQRLVKADATDRHRAPIKRLLETLSVVGDFRVEKLRLAMGLQATRHLPLRDWRSLSRIANRNLVAGYRAAHEAQRAVPHDPWPLIEGALCLAARQEVTEIAPSARDEASLRGLLSVVIARSGEFDVASRTYEKFCRNFHTLTTAVALGDFGAALLSPGHLPPHALASPALNSASIGPEDIIYASNGTRRALKQQLAAFFQETSGTLTETYFNALLKSKEGDAQGAYNIAHSLIEDIASAPTHALYSNLQLSLSLYLGELDDAIDLIAQEVARRPATRSLLPVEEALAGRPWSALASHQNKLALALSLEVFWRRSSDDLRATHLRFAFEDYLATTARSKPSELTFDDEPRAAQLVYFLRFVCLPAVMDQAGIFPSSRDLNEERIAICEKLAEWDETSAPVHNEEVHELRRALLIQDGLQIVDSSRIHVDTASISRWAERLYSESFARYEALVKAGIGIAEDLEELLRALTKNSDKLDQFIVPDNEADTLLFEMIAAMVNKFLDDPEHGLHFYLGKRIRHGTITGHLRGPLEVSHLTTQRATEHGEYLPNTHWLSKLTFATDADRERADQAFKQFAAKYDDLTAALKDRYLHVHSKEHPAGIFTIVITAQVFSIIRSAVQASLSFTNFLQVCYSFFWALLTPSLARARELLEQESKSKAVALIDELQERLRTAAIADANYLELSTAIRETSVSVQTQFDAMADWFRRTEAQQATHLFTLAELLDIAVQSALKTHKGFSPVIDVSVSGEIRATSAALVTVADIVFVFIDNACRRADAGPAPDMQIKCTFHEQEETLEFYMTNPVGIHVDRDRAEASLRTIREKIKEGDIRVGAQSDRGSGLMKIASITRQSKRGHLEFGFESANTFFTKVVVSAILKDSAIAVGLEGADS